jgi:hypothetical protein
MVILRLFSGSSPRWTFRIRANVKPAGPAPMMAIDRGTMLLDDPNDGAWRNGLLRKTSPVTPQIMVRMHDGEDRKSD